MKKLYRCTILAIALAAILVTSCTTFTPYRGNGIVEGQGGTIRVVKGIDFWENGEPNRKYRILGVIDDSRREGLIFGLVLPKDGAIAKVARKHGGDAVIFSDSSRELRGINLNSGKVKYKRITKLVVVKYLP
jgi:predicted small secreted protein